VSRTAATLGVAWGTVMRQVIQRGTALIDDPDRLAHVSAVGVDESAYLRANATRSTTFATGIADLTSGRSARLLDVVEGRSGTVLAAWLAERDQVWRAGISTASLDPFRGYATALSRQLPGAVRVLDPFHVVRLALAAVDDVRRRVQQAQTGHRESAGPQRRPVVWHPPDTAPPRRPPVGEGSSPARGRPDRRGPGRRGQHRLDHRPAGHGPLPPQ
jgi:transposase